MLKTRYWHKLDDGRVQCDVCPRRCKIHEGQRGLCYVRAVEDGEVILTSYGNASGFCIDPIEKKPLNHFLPGTPVFSFGQFGCNLTCSFCQNWDISRATRDRPDQHGIYTLKSEREKIIKANRLADGDFSQNEDISKARSFDSMAAYVSPQAIAQTARAHGCKSVAFTYNDPVIFLEYAVDTAKACHALGVKTVAVTAGYIADAPRREFFSHMDAANVDLKGFSEGFYQRLCSGHLQDVLDTLVYLKHETDVWFEITTLLIPGENDHASEIDAMTRWVVQELGVDVPMHFTAFHPDWKMRDRADTPPARLSRARSIALGNGVRYAYVGNVHDPKAESTYCHGCGECIIGRDWYVLSHWNITEDGHCATCGTLCAGVFDGPAGDWGAKRQPVDMINLEKK